MPARRSLNPTTETVHWGDLRVTQLVDGNKGIHAMVRRELLAS